MRYWAFGRDLYSGQPCEPVIVEAASPQEACSRAASQGLEVTGIELAGAADKPPASQAGGAKTRQYEFDDGQNLVIATLAFYMRILGVVVVISAAALGVLGVMAFINAPAAPGYVKNEKDPPPWVDRPAPQVVKPSPSGWLYLAEGFLSLVCGVVFFQAGQSFRKIVDTQGSDISHLMAALTKLKNVYGIAVGLICLGLLAKLISVTILY